MIYKQLQHYNGIRANNSHVIHASKLGLGSYDQSQNLILNSLCLFNGLSMLTFSVLITGQTSFVGLARKVTVWYKGHLSTNSHLVLPIPFAVMCGSSTGLFAPCL